MRRALATTSVGARPSFEASFGAAGRDEPLERLAPDHPEPPRLGEMVVRREAGELEELLDRRAVDRLRLVGLVGPARPDRVVDVHPRKLPPAVREAARS